MKAKAGWERGLPCPEYVSWSVNHTVLAAEKQETPALGRPVEPILGLEPWLGGRAVSQALLLGS